MDHSLVESLSINNLRALASRLNLSTSGSRARILDRVVDFYERHNITGLNQMESRASGSQSDNGERAEPEFEVLLPNIPSQRIQGEANLMGERNPSVTQYNRPGSIENNAAPSQSFPGIQEIVRAVVQVLNENQHTPLRTEGPSQLTREASAGSANLSANSNNWHQIKFATKLIPTFAGKEEENVVKWLERITSVAGLYSLSNEVIVLAAITQLKDRALEWYNRQALESVSSWENFKFNLRRHFEVKESYTATLARIGQRVWKAQTEKFIDYAEDKLTLMQMVSLTEKEKIDLLADGVKDPVLRKLVLSTWINNIPDFLEHVRRITKDTMLPKPKDTNVRFGGRGNQVNKNLNYRPTSLEKTCFNCKQPGHLSKDCTQQKRRCFKCGQEEHISTTCAMRGASPKSNASHLIDHQESTAETRGTASTATLHINTVEGANKNRACVKIWSVSNPNVSLEALIDTGSPVSLIIRL